MPENTAILPNKFIIINEIMDKIRQNLLLVSSRLNNIPNTYNIYLTESDKQNLIIIDDLKSINKFLLDIIKQCLIIPTEFTAIITSKTLQKIKFYAPLTLEGYKQIQPTSWEEFIHNLSYLDILTIAFNLDSQLDICLSKYKNDSEIMSDDAHLFEFCNQLTVTLLNKIILENSKHGEQTLQIDESIFTQTYKIKFKNVIIPRLTFKLIIPIIANIIIEIMNDDFIRSIDTEVNKKNTDKNYKSILLLASCVNIMNSFAIFQIIEKMISSETDEKVLDKIGIDYLVSTYYAKVEQLKEEQKKRPRFRARAKYHKYKIKYLNLIK